MLKWFGDLDRILRGEATRVSDLREARIDVPAGGLSMVLVVLGICYGFCMGWFALFNHDTPEFRQLVASTIKVPALFFLTLFVTFPSLYVFNALLGSRLGLLSLLRLLLAAIGVVVAVLASFGPITAFFSVSTTNYSFMVLLNVAIFGAAGMLGLTFLLQTLHRLTLIPLEESLVTPPPPRRALPEEPAPIEPSPEAPSSSEPTSADRAHGEPAVPEPSPTDVVESVEPEPPPTPPASAEREGPGPGALRPPRVPGPLGPLDERGISRDVRIVFRCWMVVFALVGCQMGWVLRPFVGNPAEPFEWFRKRESNFFESVWSAWTSLFW